jgi:hypothetical protein
MNITQKGKFRKKPTWALIKLLINSLNSLPRKKISKFSHQAKTHICIFFPFSYLSPHMTSVETLLNVTNTGMIKLFQNKLINKLKLKIKLESYSSAFWDSRLLLLECKYAKVSSLPRKFCAPSLPKISTSISSADQLFNNSPLQFSKRTFWSMTIELLFSLRGFVWRHLNDFSFQDIWIQLNDFSIQDIWFQLNDFSIQDIWFQLNDFSIQDIWAFIYKLRKFELSFSLRHFDRGHFNCHWVLDALLIVTLL